MIAFLLQGFLCLLIAGLSFLLSGKLRTGQAPGTTASRLLGALALGYNANFAATMITVFAFDEYVYRMPHDLHFWGLYSLGTLGCALVMWLLVRLFRRFFRPELETRRHFVRDGLWGLVGAALLGLAALCFFISRWFFVFFGKLSPDQFTFLIVGGGGDATADTNAQIANFMKMPVIGFLLFGLELGFLRRTLRPGRGAQDSEAAAEASDSGLRRSGRGIPAWKTRLTATFLSMVLLGGSFIYAVHHIPIIPVFNSQFNPSDFIEDHYVEPERVVHFPSRPRNLIHIYMESVENSYYDKEHGGYDERNLMPDLEKLNRESVHFSHTNKEFGGPHQTYGASHSVAGMLNMGAGMSMKTAVSGGTSEPMLYPFFTTVGDLLHEQGYNTEIMMGARAKWGGLGDYYRSHGDFKVFDYDYAKDNGYIPKDYKVFWGYEDDKIYVFAQEELTRLYKEGKPFYFILENADTHFPDGYPSPNMKEKPFPEQYANVIHYSQAEVVRFVNWVKSQPFYKDTTIVITGDHRSMDKKFFAGWDPAYERTVVNMFINPAIPYPAPERMRNRDFAPFDIFPTTLAAMGIKIDGDRCGLGTNLFSDKKTLVEEFGLDEVNDELSRPCYFYSSYRRPGHEGKTAKRLTGMQTGTSSVSSSAASEKAHSAERAKETRESTAQAEHGSSAKTAGRN